jgi:hypothetical protein
MRINQRINYEKDTWLVVDKDGKVYETGRTKSYLIINLKKLGKEYFRHDLKIIKNDK